MKLTVASPVLEAFPDVRIGLLVLQGANNRSRGELGPRLEGAQARAVAELAGASVVEHPHIACWREAYRFFGAKPKKYPSSIENLLRRALKGEPLRSINPIVDAYNIVSLTHLIPAGGEDLDAVQGDIELTRASAGESPVQLLGEPEARAPKAGEIFYKDDFGAICRRWNWKEAERSKLTEATTRAVLVLETLPPVTRDALDAALEQLRELVIELTEARVTKAILDRDTPTTELQ